MANIEFMTDETKRVIQVVKDNAPCHVDVAARVLQLDRATAYKKLHYLVTRRVAIRVDVGTFIIPDYPIKTTAKPIEEKRPPMPRYTPPLRIKPKLQMNIYLFQYAGYFKIGITKDVAMRQRKIQAYIPEELIIVHSTPCENARAVELSLHERYAHRRVRGEWFKLDFCEVQEIVTLLSIDSQVAVES
jgi:hypothetical protein